MNDRDLHDVFGPASDGSRPSDPDAAGWGRRGRQGRRRGRALVFGTTGLITGGLVTVGLVTGIVPVGDWGSNDTAPAATGNTTQTTGVTSTTPPADNSAVGPTHEVTTPRDYSSLWTGPISTVRTGPFQTTPAPPKFRTPPPFDDRVPHPPVMVDGVSVLTVTEPGDVDQTRRHIPAGVLDAPTAGDAAEAGELPIHAARWVSEGPDKASLEIMHSDRVWRSTQYAEGGYPAVITADDVVLPTRVYLVPGGEYVVVLHPESMSVIARDGSVRPIALPDGSQAAGLDMAGGDPPTVHVIPDQGGVMSAVNLADGVLGSRIEPPRPVLGKTHGFAGWRLREAGVWHSDSSGRTVQQMWIEKAPSGFVLPETAADEGVLALAVMDGPGRGLRELIVLPQPTRHVDDLSVIAAQPEGLLFRILGSGDRSSWVGSYDGTTVVPLGVIDRGVTVSPELIVPGSSPYADLTDPVVPPATTGPGRPKFTPPPRG